MNCRFCSLSFQNPDRVSTNPVNASMVSARQFLTICGLAERCLLRSANPIPRDACTPCRVLCPLAFLCLVSESLESPDAGLRLAFSFFAFHVSISKTCLSLIVDVVIRFIAISELPTNCVSSNFRPFSGEVYKVWPLQARLMMPFSAS